MNAVISNNVIKLSTGDAPVPPKSTGSEYPRTCDFCRDTYISELTFKRHKEIGKCFRFCRLREEQLAKSKKSPKPSLYPRTCEKCKKTYKNKHSYYKHKDSCCNKDRTNPVRDEAASANVSTISSNIAEVDVVELSKDDIENIPITDNKENIDDFDANFILTLDVDKNFPSSNSLYPRICELCNKVFKSKYSFSIHRSKSRCSGQKQNSAKTNTLKFPHRCEKCNKMIRHKQFYHAHKKRCGQTVLPTVSSLKKATDFVPVKSSAKTKPTPMWSTFSPQSTTEPSYPRTCTTCGRVFQNTPSYFSHRCATSFSGEKPRSIYPRTCEFCGFVFNTKFSFHRHKKRCPGYMDGVEGKFNDQDTYVSCDYCPSTFDTVVLFRLHMMNVHPNVKLATPVRRPYLYPRKCSKCLITYLSRQTYWNHKKRCAGNCVITIDPNSSEVTETWAADDSEKVVYPRKCLKCNRTYANRQSFCNHKRICLDIIDNNYESPYSDQIQNVNEIFTVIDNDSPGSDSFKSIYPRTCDLCHRSYSCKQSYRNHLETCIGQGKLMPDYDDYEDDQDQTHYDAETESKSNRNKSAYPKMCELCRRIYANRQTFHKHKSRCVPIVPLVSLVESGTFGGMVNGNVYPRECENCLGTFKCETTFNAHKIRCDFFEANVDESKFKSSIESNCEHCRNILSQYRRIFHQHLEQCTDPVIIARKELRNAENLHLNNASSRNDGLDAKDFARPNVTENVHFCECCGVFFESDALLEKHKKTTLSENTSNRDCDICMITFDSENEFLEHKSKCVLNSSNKTYPRFCECCRKIYKTKQTFYNHKKNCHIYCFKYFVFKDCEHCAVPFKCEKIYNEHVLTCIKNNPSVETECEVPAT